MKIYNTLTRRKEEFVPLEEGKVRMYACGITVSGEPHIGHAFQVLIYDIMRKYLQKKGYSVRYARNYTDVDDKIIKKSQETGIPADKYAEMMIKKTDSVMREFGVDDPDIWLKATENIGNIIDFVQALISNGHAYAAESGNVYFDVSSFPSYGCLSNRSVEDMLDGVRVENAEEKRNPADFALWKAAKPGEICWDSPWGKGRPGWHIECSAMNRAAFGDQIDIHGGGRDLIFPHHENEIAQSESLTGKQFAKYWTHNGLIKVNGQKMSKSLGNSLLLEDLLKKYTNEAIKFALLQNNYRNDINITDTLFPEAEKHLSDFYRVLKASDDKFGVGKGGNAQIDEQFDRCMDDDFNTALALSDLFGIFKGISAKVAAGDATAADDCAQVRKTYSLLGLFRKQPEEYFAEVSAKNAVEIPEEVKKLAEERWNAKKSKNWPLADELRAKIDALGYSVKDSKDGYEVTRK
ncbi:MAG TPA: cysteine--tRNA ligase [Candidatus Coproplasma excrementigallinarum]|uniref:Cysteine--tRNA ligase n=1 Tax=Candidatus Coproplasma excrementigallinarum TaxID=2840747 RepID=A0A9D1ML28_9FIRM|nr:cysteine--tRNA ligase [Candidatus Coproplasma excrementigallinarum]